MEDLFERLRALKAGGTPFAVATVVRAERPTYARPGMKAVILADGTLEGWVGGSCAHPVVVREAAQSIREGSPRLISLSLQQANVREGIIHHTITCHSGGTLEIYIEPVLPAPHLLLVGDAPVVRSLVRLGRSQGFTVSVADVGEAAQHLDADAVLPLADLRGRITPQTYVVVATMGAYDEEALTEVAGTDAAYLALVASRKRAESVFTYLADRGVASEALQRVKVPAGLDIGALTPEEIALSIMAEIIQVRRSRPANAAPVPVRSEARDPVCGMTVEVTTARYASVYEGVKFYFCSAQCKETFDRDPAPYAAVHT